MLINTEESVMANFDFLAREDDLEDEDEVCEVDDLLLASVCFKTQGFFKGVNIYPVFF